MLWWLSYQKKEYGIVKSQVKIILLECVGRQYQSSSCRAANVHYGQWNPESYLSQQGRMKFLQYGTGCAGEGSEVTESTVPYLLKQVLV